MGSSSGRKTVSIMRGLMMLCEVCYEDVNSENLVDAKGYVADTDTLFDLICPGCMDLNRPLIDDMLGSSE